MAIAYVICPYDTIHDPHGIGRVSGMKRYQPVSEAADGSKIWVDLETLANQAVVKIDLAKALTVNPNINTQIAGDAQFNIFPHATDPIPIGATRTLVNNKFLALGFTQAEINLQNWHPMNLLQLLATKRSVVTEDATHTLHTYTAGVFGSPAELFADFDAAVPG